MTTQTPPFVSGGGMSPIPLCASRSGPTPEEWVLADTPQSKKKSGVLHQPEMFLIFFWKNCPKMCLDDFQGFLAWLFTPSYNFCGFVFAARKRPRSILCLPLPASLHLCSQQKILAVNISNPCIPYLWHLKRCRKRVFSTVPFNLQCHP